MEILAVKPEHVAQIWHTVSPYLEKAIQRQEPRLITTDYLRAICEDAEATLLISVDGSELIGCAIIKRDVYPLATVCHIEALGGQDGRDWIGMMDQKIHEIASLNGCNLVMSMGRKGWVRAKPDYSTGNMQFYKEVG